MEQIQNKVLGQMANFQKMVFDNAFNMMTTLQGHSQKIVDMSLAQNSWFHAAGNNVITEWITAFQKNCNGMKEFADLNFSKTKEYSSDSKAASASNSAEPVKVASTSNSVAPVKTKIKSKKPSPIKKEA